MATMSHRLIRPGRPPGEVNVFEALRDHPGTADWIVWHGLPIRHHETQVEGEADFVVVIPGEGMLVVEVKSHERVEVGDDGLWRTPQLARGSSSPTQPPRGSSSPTQSGVSRPSPFAQRIPDAATMTLTSNVRQTPQLAELIEELLDDELYIGFDRDAEEEPDDLPLTILRYGTEAEQQEQLASALMALWEDGWNPGEILILSPRRASAASRASGAVADTLASHDGDANGTPWGTVHAFKGLEAPAVVLTDVDGTSPRWHDLLYIGATRATERLVVLTSLDEIAGRAPLQR